MRLLLQALFVLTLFGAAVLTAVTSYHLAADLIAHGFIPAPEDMGRRWALTWRALAALVLVGVAWILALAIR